MNVVELETSARAGRVNRRVEASVNRVVRGYDAARLRIGLGGRKAPYDDLRYEFLGGPHDGLRRKHYDKSMRLLWKAEDKAPWLSFRDNTPAERQLQTMATRSLTKEERAARTRLSLPEYKALLDREYTPRQKQAIVNILAPIGHGEAYAWLTSAELLGTVRSTGARAALTMQVLEEAKHFVVLRELLQSFDVQMPRQSVWEYMLLERVLKAKGLEKFFGMNVLVEGIALSFFGLMSELPGLEVLRQFHLDESRHTALPGNYLSEFPLSAWQSHNPVACMRRLNMVLPALALLPHLEEDMAVLGLDAFDFGGSVVRKVSTLAERNGFMLPIPQKQLLALLDQLFNGYCSLSRPNHVRKRFTQQDTTVGEEARAVEREIFLGAAAG